MDNPDTNTWQLNMLLRQLRQWRVSRTRNSAHSRTGAKFNHRSDAILHGASRPHNLSLRLELYASSVTEGYSSIIIYLSSTLAASKYPRHKRKASRLSGIHIIHHSIKKADQCRRGNRHNKKRGDRYFGSNGLISQQRASGHISLHRLMRRHGLK